jgi:hypothetical protein
MGWLGRSHPSTAAVSSERSQRFGMTTFEYPETKDLLSPVSGS